MKPASQQHRAQASLSEPALDSMLERLEALSREPVFLAQREIALARALHPYVSKSLAVRLEPLPQEIALAKLYLYADFYPEDGQLSLIEQLRDTITIHIPEEERAWLDPLQRSSMDLLEAVSVEAAGSERTWLLRSLGDRCEFHVAISQDAVGIQPGQALLTRLIRLNERTVMPVVPVVLSAANARALMEATDRWRQLLETESGAFTLAEWHEFAKRYGYVLLWNLAHLRSALIIKAEASASYRRPSGEPVLYALALYEHDAYPVLAEGLANMRDLVFEAAESAGESGLSREPRRSWVVRDSDATGRLTVVARLTLTPVQLLVECDSPSRLDQFKHRLAAAFGFLLQFRGEATATPAHQLKDVDLTAEVAPTVVQVPSDEERQLQTAFLETVYLDWADRPSPALRGQTPRHAAADPRERPKVEALIRQLEQDDPVWRRTGQAGYDYDRLRQHVGL